MRIEDRLWALDEPNVYITKEQYMAALDGWKIEEHVAGAVLTKGPELHFKTFGNVGITRADIRRYLQPLLDAYGYVITRTPKDDYRQQRFNRVIGFVDVGEDEFYTQFKMEHLRCR